MNERGTLFVVATPLGNLEDITLRALRVLKEVDLVAAEDTRRTRNLLVHYGIGTPLTSYYDQIERRKAPQLVAALLAGKNLALVSDAGTPGIADPGYHLVRAAIAADIRVEAVPGPSAIAAALSVAGLATDRFVFEGFVPSKAGARRAFVAALADETRTTVVYEAARRLMATLQVVHEVLGDREVAVVRELTKVFEDVRRGPVARLLDGLAAHPEALKGEVTVVIAGAPRTPPVVATADVEATVARLRAGGQSMADIARQVARDTGLPRRTVYEIGVRLEAERAPRR
jgi:16S rRNA (cytidine1402-2'-O)-methyltransferase